MRTIAFIMQHLDNALPPVENGSVAIWIYNAATELAQSQKDYVIRIYGYHHELFQTRVINYKNVTYYFLPAFLTYVWEKSLRIISLIKKILAINAGKAAGGQSRNFTTSTYGLSYILPIAWHLKKHPCDIIHISNFTQFVPVVRFFNPKSKIVLHMHCEWISQLAKQIMEPRLIKTDLILGCSSYITQKIKSAYPAYAEHVKTVHNGVDIDHFQSGIKLHPAKKETRLLFVGRISPEKGLHTLIEAFNKIVAAAHPVRLDIIGDDRMLPKDFIVGISELVNVRALARFYVNTDNRYYAALLKKMLTSAAKKRINFLGSLPHSEVAAYYRQADILINPSLSESFGISLIEALACGLVVVATRVGGMRDIIEHEKHGLLVEPESPAALTEALRRLITDQALFNSLQQAGHQHCVKSFSWSKITRDLLRAYQPLI